MNELETQVAKIQVGDARTASTYVHVMAEKVDATDTELYVLCELPMFNPAALADCERICEAISASLKRSYRHAVTEQSFENALAQINEELGKLATIGKTHWIGKLNALIATKRGTALSIATVGKITALLYRDDGFASITEATTAPAPLKTFDNFAVGRLRLNDLLIFSTTQLLNHISIDRIRQILEDGTLPEAAGMIIEILRENAGPEVACATILALQVEPGMGRDEEIDMQPYIATSEQVAAGGTAGIGGGILGMSARAKGIPALVIKHAQGFASSVMSKLHNRPRPSIGRFVSSNKAAVGVVNQQFKRAAQNLHPETFRRFSSTKKFFFISAAILLIAIIVSIGVTIKYRSNKATTVVVKANIAELQKLADDSNSAFIYKDLDKARTGLSELQDKLKAYNGSSDSAVESVRKQAQELDDKLNKRTGSTVTQIGTLGHSDNLISLPAYLATETNRTIISYNRASGSVQDNTLHSSEPIAKSAFFKGNQALIYNGNELLLWNFQNGLMSKGFNTNVPSRDHIAGFKIYPTNSRAYLIDKSTKQIISFALTDKDITKPVISVNANELANASDLAIDGGIYVTTNGTILKYLSGAAVPFTPALPSKLSDSAKIYTQADFKNIYVLDPGNKRIIILDKKGALVSNLNNSQFSTAKDFSIDEKSKTIYLLADGQLLKTGF